MISVLGARSEILDHYVLGKVWTSGEKITPSTALPGYFDQLEKAARFAARFTITHGDKLKAIRLKGNTVCTLQFPL